MNDAVPILMAVAAIILARGVSSALQTYVKNRRDALQVAADGGGPLAARLDEVEARLRDVLDVMLAVSEKMDRWELQAGTRPQTPRGTDPQSAARGPL